MDFDIFDALLLDSEFSRVETSFSTTSPSASSSPGDTKQEPNRSGSAEPSWSGGLPCPATQASAPSPPLPSVAERRPPPPPPPAPEWPPPSPRPTDSYGSGSDSDASVRATDATPPPPPLPPRVSSGEHRAHHFLPPCRVCAGLASGLHYGVNTCDACKGFFFRSLQCRSLYTCSKAGKCQVSYTSRSMCSACRYQRCLAVGMKKDAVKTGRYPHTKRTQDTLEVKWLQRRLQSKSVPHSTYPDASERPPVSYRDAWTGSLDDSPSAALAECLTSAFERSFPDTLAFYNEPKRIEALVRDTLLLYNTASADFVMCGDPGDRNRVVEMREEVLNALRSVPTCDTLSCEGNPSGVQVTLLIKIYLERFEAVVKSIVNFAKSIPGFTSLNMHDQIVLIKAGRPEVVYLLKYKHLDLKLSCTIDYNFDKNVVNLVPLSAMRRVWQDEEFHRQCWSNAERLQQLDLSVSDVALLAAVALASPDREHLLEPERVHEIQETLVAALRHSIAAHRCHGDLPAADRFLASLLLQLPQLRTLNLQNELFAASVQRRYPFSLPPLVQECLSTQQPDDVQCSSAETAVSLGRASTAASGM